MTSAVSLPSRCSLRSSIVPRTRSSLTSLSNLKMRSSSARVWKVKACATEPPSESAGSSVRKVFIVKPNENGFAVIIEITSAESVLVQESTVGTVVSTTELVPKKEPNSAKGGALKLLDGGKHIFSKYLEDDLKKSLGKFDLIKVLHVAGLATRFPWLGRFEPIWQIILFLVKLYLFSPPEKKEK